jgi:hypothetical protein
VTRQPSSPPADPGQGAVLDVDLAFGHHLLAVGDDVDPDEVEMLAMSWFAHAGWVADRVLALTEDAVLTGPWQVDDAVRRSLHLGPAAAQVLLLRCPVLRGGAPPEQLAAADPLTRAFRDGVPYGIEAEALAFLLAAARRLRGALRAAGSGAVLEPDPENDVNLLLHSSVWLDPDALVATLRPVLPTVRLATELSDFVPPAAPQPPEVSGVEPLDEGERAWLHAEADAFDEAALSGPAVLDSYGAVAELAEDGLLEVTVAGEENLPLVLERLDWTASGVVAYTVRWWPPDEAAAASEAPGAVFLAQRGRARALVERAALALHGAAGGELTDESGFLVEPESLGD